jgi:hypothetical protein
MPGALFGGGLDGLEVRWRFEEPVYKNLSDEFFTPRASLHLYIRRSTFHLACAWKRLLKFFEPASNCSVLTWGYSVA